MTTTCWWVVERLSILPLPIPLRLLPDVRINVSYLPLIAEDPMGLNSSKFKVVNKLNEGDKLILLLGGSGAGKSRFLDLICEQQNPEVSSRVDNNLMKTKDDGFCFVRIEIDYRGEKHSIIVMDSKAIVEHSTEIKKCLSSKSLGKKNIHLLGVLLLQKFTDNRVTGDGPDTRFPFVGIIREIFGSSDFTQKTNLVLTHADRNMEKEIRVKRLEGYSKKFKKMFPGREDQSSIFEHTNTSQSAQMILTEIVTRGLAEMGF
ncbi:hypothetical protein BJ165DRAFT_1507357 [Panaeolus papilionaceus]|nr:hypothetical protein BJ165DRAFT_1507357 [Panaeolus papilionaceus]